MADYLATRRKKKAKTQKLMEAAGSEAAVAAKLNRKT